MTTKFNSSLDQNNSKLLQELEDAGVQIEFEIKEGFDHWAVQNRPKYIIAAPNNNPNPESLAHELLHIKIDELGFLTTDKIMIIFNQHNCCFDSKEIPTWQNILAHCKMIPEFVGLGYPAEKFVANYGNEFILKELLPIVAKLSGSNDFNKPNSLKPTIEHITDFIAVIISTKNLEIENKFSAKILIDHETIYSELKKIDETLFTAIYSQLTNWVDSNCYSNFHFYTNLNNCLYQLGYPTESNWGTWQNDK